MGDPLGIGSEIILKALPKFRERAEFLVFGDEDLLAELPAPELRSGLYSNRTNKWEGKSAGEAAVAYLDAAMEAYRAGKIQALVTAPISKEHVQMAGFPFPGHTEYLAHQTQTKKFAMMMAGPKLRVVLVTIHEALAKVPSLLNEERIAEVIELTHLALQNWFGISKPSIAVCGLNPHAGEAGLLGKEEIRVIGPAIALAAQRGYGSEGPKVPDAVFHEAYQGKWDAVICMYHDQGLIPFKMIHFENGVNLTLGLPLVRTSPDHGTAFDIAGKGKADSTSMEAAINLAIRIATR